MIRTVNTGRYTTAVTKSLSARIGRGLHKDRCLEYGLISVDDIVMLLQFQKSDGDAIGLQVR